MTPGSPGTPPREATVPRQKVKGYDEDEGQRWLDESELARFFGAVAQLDAAKDENSSPAPLWLGVGWALGYHLGLRPGEIRALAWEDIDLTAPVPTLHVQHGQRTREREARQGSYKEPCLRSPARHT